MWIHKSVQYIDFEAKSVLSNDPWAFVELWLRRINKTDALAFKMQARRFAKAASTMSVEAAPLTLYYAFLIATKTVLEVRSAQHGKNMV